LRNQGLRTFSNGSAKVLILFLIAKNILKNVKVAQEKPPFLAAEG
jgi:hypothetical protein